MKRVLIISIIILVVVVIAINSNIFKKVENFNCVSCGRNDWTVGPRRCLSCYNCGWCEKSDGSGSCKIANPIGTGPLFAENCHRWYQGGRARLYYTSYPWYNPLYWYYRVRPVRMGRRFRVRQVGRRRWRFF